MTTIFCHPANLELIRSQIESKGSRPCSPEGVLLGGLLGIQVITCNHMDQYRDDGYRLPDGSVVRNKDEIVVKDRFVEYGPEDLWWLLYTGRVTVNRTQLFYVMQNPIQKAWTWYD